MNLEQLRSFTEVARLGHFTRAAEGLHVTQPSLSRQIATLETELGVELFHRARGNIALTAAGERLLPRARRMLTDAESARAEMAELAGLRAGRVRIGATPTLCTSLVAETLTGFRARYPGVEVEILERGSRSLIASLAEGALDLALIVDTEAPAAAFDTLDRTPMLTERLVVVERAEGGAISASMPVTLDQLAATPQVMFPDSYDLHTTMSRAFKAAGLSPVVAVHGAEMDASLRFVERGLGVAVVPAMVALDRPLLRAHPLADPALSRTVSFARRADMTLTHAGAAMRDALLATTAQLTAAGAVTARFVSRA
ncbi:DNA-binding transcriptional LysR family regulator [Leucobacter exalbidus]|uniref:DNA-binding transcriptional LysR family regulator n=1 Tax=Leucobacter exalbidus TaxID=662960 RepID=A0A940PRV6_9MICO|nr:LysR family transcriptional regulator [Leucobacter exalbidus]MBP1325633.1 DNA-binding transcriptional LysR family regulator [Leucobacter exalbidus]